MKYQPLQYTYIICYITCRDMVQPPVFVTAALKRKKTKLALSSLASQLVGPSLAPVYNPAKHKSFALPITRNVRPTPLIWIRILAFCLCNTLFSCSIVWNRSSHWYWWFSCTVACPASRDIDCRVTAWKFHCPFNVGFYSNHFNMLYTTFII